MNNRCALYFITVPYHRMVDYGLSIAWCNTDEYGAITMCRLKRTSRLVRGSWQMRQHWRSKRRLAVRQRRQRESMN